MATQPKITLDPSKLLGFSSANVDGGSDLSPKFGAKDGAKTTPKFGAKLGVKFGLKVGTKV